MTDKDYRMLHVKNGYYIIVFANDTERVWKIYRYILDFKPCWYAECLNDNKVMSFRQSKKNDVLKQLIDYVKKLQDESNKN
jgi:hypothetical protein